MTRYSLVFLDPSTGRLTELPWRFERREEAASKAAELALVHPDRSYAVRILPAA
jgi:hypothetical protein